MPSKVARLRALFGFSLYFWLLAAFAAAEENTLTVYTGEWVPYNYQEGREIRGLSTEILRAMCAEARIECGINYVPWVRAYKTVQNTRNALLYTVARKPERENEFLWIGPILARATYVYARSSLEHLPANAQDLSTLRVGVVRGEGVRVEGGAGGHRQDPPGGRLDRDQRTLALAIPGFDQELQPRIDGQLEVVAAVRIDPRQRADRPAAGRHLDFLDAGFAVQFVFVAQFQAQLADVGRAGIAG